MKSKRIKHAQGVHPQGISTQLLNHIPGLSTATVRNMRHNQLLLTFANNAAKTDFLAKIAGVVGDDRYTTPSSLFGNKTVTFNNILQAANDDDERTVYRALLDVHGYVPSSPYIAGGASAAAGAHASDSDDSESKPLLGH